MEKGPEYQLLGKFVGQWTTTGRILTTTNGSEIKIAGTDTYRWLPGAFFLLHQVDVFVGEDKNETHEIIGYDKSKNQYTMQYFDNKGNTGRMTATCIEGLWTFLGETLRFVGGFKNDDHEFSGIWEQTVDGQVWSAFMEIKLSKVIQ